MEEKLLTDVLSTETQRRLTTGDRVLEYFRDENNIPEEFQDLDTLIAGLAAWMGSSHFKVSTSAMEIVTLLVTRMKERFRPHISTVFPPIRERLGDAKDQVREKTQLLIQQILQDAVSSPQVFLDKVMDGTLAHKNWRVKEQGLKCLSRTLDFFGSGQVSVGKFIGKICDLLGDANVQVRTAAIDSLVDIYHHVGVKVRVDLGKRGLPPAKLQQLFSRFDEIDVSSNNVNHGGHSDEISAENTDCEPMGSSSSPSLTKHATTSNPTITTTKSKGALDTEHFAQGFNDTPHLNIFTAADVEKTMSSIEQTLVNMKNNWTVRVTALKELRALIQSDIVDNSSFVALLRPLERAMRDSLKDLRSQVVREAAVTLSCLCVHLGTELAQFVEQLLPQLVALLPNSAKVMSSSANLCIIFIIKHSPHHRHLIPLLQTFNTSKSPISRRCCAELVSQAVLAWEPSMLEKQMSLIEESLTKGLKDADTSARKHMRKVYWAYHAHFPAEANRIFESCDSQQQKLLTNERNGGGDQSVSRNTTISPKLKIIRKPNAQPELVRVDYSNSIDHLPPRPPSASAVLGKPPSIKVRPPTIRSTTSNHGQGSSTNSLSAAARSISRSTENLASSPPTATPIRPPSRSGAASTAKKTKPQVVSEFKRPRTPVRASRSARTSPVNSRESSPVRVVPKGASMPRSRHVALTTESLRNMSIHDMMSGRGDDEDDCASVTSERSSFSISSEMSISPYACAKFPNPITDLDELVRLCASRQWSDRRDGIAQLHLLMETGRPMTHNDMLKVREVFKRMFSEPHSKVYGMFLETLTRFIECHREYMDDWLFLMLLQLLHKQGTDILKSLQFKLQIVLEEVRKAFEVDKQFHELCRILVDAQRPMNNKVKLAWLDYLNELLPSMESSDFTESSDIKQAFSKLLGLTIDPKSAELRRTSQQIVAALFDLNASTFTMMCRTLPINLRESSDRIIRSHLQNSPDDSPTSSPVVGFSTAKKGVSKFSTSKTSSSPNSMSLRRQISSSSPDITQLAPLSSLPASLTPSTLTPSSPRSRIPTPSTSSSGRRGRSRIPLPRSGNKQNAIPPRAMSVDPERMLNTNQFSLHRPTSSQSTHVSVHRRPNTDLGFTSSGYDMHGRPPSSQGFMLDHFITHLPVLDFGTSESEAEPKDQVGLLVKQLVNAANVKLKTAALQGLHTLARAYDHSCWHDHLPTLIPEMLSELKQGEVAIQAIVLRLFRELLKNPSVHPHAAPFTASLTTTVIMSYSSSELNISQLAEDLFSLLASSLPSQTMVEQLGPLVGHKSETILLAAIKLLTKVVAGTTEPYLSSMLPEIAPGVVQGYCHTESKVRKAGVFCLVAIYSIVGENLRPHLTALSSAQTKLLNLYIRRQEDGKTKSSSTVPK